MFLLGDVFLRNYYSVYNLNKQTVSLAVNLHAKDYAGIGKYSNSFMIYIALQTIAIILSIFIYRHFAVKQEQ